MESIAQDCTQDHSDIYIHMVNDKFYETYNEKIKIIVKKMLSQTAMTQDIDDCVNMVYLKIISSPDVFDEKRGSMETYISLIARSVVLNHLKSNGKLRNELIGDDFFDFYYSPAEYENEIEFNTLVESILKRLKTEERVLFTMRYIRFNTPEEIARALGIKRGTVDMRCKRLKEKIRKFLNN